MMTEQDIQDLREFQCELISAERSAWEPDCVAGAFCSAWWTRPFVFTIQTWIDLDAVGSPFLQDRLPDAEEALRRFDEAFQIFGHTGTTPEQCDAEQLILIGNQILAAIRESFAMRLRLEPPEGCKAVSIDNGVGDWLPILACLKTQMGFSLAEARSLPVGQAFALIAAHRVNEGWSVSGETYRQREVED